MPFPDTKDPIVLNFLLECYEKEAHSRLRWREKHSEMFQTAAVFKKELKNYTYADIDYALAAAGMAATTRDYIEAARHRLTKTKHVDATITDSVSYSALQKMFPINPELESLRVEQGRKAYLKKRNELSPEDKYVYPETSSGVYGWRLNDTEIKTKAVQYPRLGVMKRNLYSNVGPQPDPSHYHDPNSAVSFCSKFT